MISSGGADETCASSGVGGGGGPPTLPTNWERSYAAADRLSQVTFPRWSVWTIDRPTRSAYKQGNWTYLPTPNRGGLAMKKTGAACCVLSVLLFLIPMQTVDAACPSPRSVGYSCYSARGCYYWPSGGSTTYERGCLFPAGAGCSRSCSQSCYHAYPSPWREYHWFRYCDALPKLLETSLTGAFWSKGTGSPSIGLGDDSGSLEIGSWLYEVYARAWRCFDSEYPCPGSPVPMGYSFWTDWSKPGVDGCIDDRRCTLLMFSDFHEGQGYFALITTTSQIKFPFSGTVLAPIPAPEVSLPAAIAPLESRAAVTVTAPSFSDFQDGLYSNEGYALTCDQDDLILGYNLYRAVSKPGGGFTGTGLNAGLEWLPINENPIPLGESVTIEMDCSLFALGLYLAGAPVFDSGFETAYKSEVVGPISCRPTVSLPFPQP